MKTVKLHFCDGKGYEMKEMWLTPSYTSPKWEATKHYICPMCSLLIEDGKKIKGVLTERRKDNGMANP